MSDEPEGIEEEGTREGVSRRRVLKGMAAAGAIAWATPVVQTVNMQRAWASQTSPGRVCYRIKIEDTGACDEGIGENDCLTEGTFESGGCAATSPVLVKDSTQPDCIWTVTVDSDCIITDATAKAGRDCVTGGNLVVTGLNTNSVTINTCAVKFAISHVELVVCCEQQAQA